MPRNIKKFQREVYDKWADTYDQSCWVRWIISWANNFAKEIPENSSIIDIGCGTGDVLLQLTKRTPSLLAGIDISPKAADKAKNRLSQHDPDIKVGDAENHLPWPDKSFDIAVITSTIHHFPNPEKVLHEVSRILKPKSKLIIADPNFPPIILQIINLFLKIYPLNGDIRFSSQRGLRNLVKRCNFKEIKQKPAGFFAKYTVANN
jgi:ubiquinone/menaquinone biosynthesis C-methylase UbiE